jgi:TrmH family RNA methyltransferase
LKISKAEIKQVRSLQMKKFRDELGLFVAEGDKCVEELQKGFGLLSLYREGGNATHTEIAQMSGLQTPQGTIGVFRKRPEDTALPAGEGLVLALDGVQNPGNLGTIIRTCDWFGVHDIVCSRDTADCYNPKVVQATMGALVRVRVHYADLPAWLEELRVKNNESKIYGTLLDGKDMYEVLQSEGRSGSKAVIQQSGHTAQRSVIIMGNEGNGISEEVRRYITHPIRIPSYPEDAETSESLNVSIATAIVLAEMRRVDS